MYQVSSDLSPHWSDLFKLTSLMGAASACGVITRVRFLEKVVWSVKCPSNLLTSQEKHVKSSWSSDVIGRPKQLQFSVCGIGNWFSVVSARHTSWSKSRHENLKFIVELIALKEVTNRKSGNPCERWSRHATKRRSLYFSWYKSRILRKVSCFDHTGEDLGTFCFLMQKIKIPKDSWTISNDPCTLKMAPSLSLTSEWNNNRTHVRRRACIS